MESEQIIQEEINKLRREKKSGKGDVIKAFYTGLALSHIAKKHNLNFLPCYKQIEKIYS